MPHPRDVFDRLQAMLEPDPFGGCLLFAGATTPHGYAAMRSGGRGSKGVYGHRIAFEHYHRPLRAGEVVMHTCDIPQCCNPNHLRAGSFAENMADMVRKGRSAKGERSGLSKLCEADVVAIRKDRRALQSIAKDYGVCMNQVSRVKRRIDWKHVA